MKTPDDHLLNLNEYIGDYERLEVRTNFKRYRYNYELAAGIIYKVDVKRPQGDKTTIRSMYKGKPVDLFKT